MTELPAPTEKLCQLAIILSDDWLIVIAAPDVAMDAAPDVTVPPVGSTLCASAGVASTAVATTATAPSFTLPPLRPCPPLQHSGTMTSRPSVFDQMCL